MKQLPDVLTSVAFWAAVGTLWSAAGAWFTYVAATSSSRRQDYDGISNLISGIEAELDLVSEWAHGDEGDQGFLASKTRLELVKENPDWFNPSRMIFKFDTPALNSLTSSPFAKSAVSQLPSFVRLNLAIRRLLDYVDRLNAFALGDLGLYQSVLVKYGYKGDPADLASSTIHKEIVVPLPHTIPWTTTERIYINHLFLMNESIHQKMIGGAEGPPNCLYLEFRRARKELQKMKAAHLRPKSLPWWYWILHALAGWFIISGAWEVFRWLR